MVHTVRVATLREKVKAIGFGGMGDEVWGMRASIGATCLEDVRPYREEALCAGAAAA